MGFYSIIDCAEVKDTATENWTQSGITAQVTLECTGANRIALCQDLLINARPWPHLDGLMLNPPRAYEATPVGFSTDAAVLDQMYQWDTFRVSVKYTTRPELITLSERIEPAADFIKLDHRYFRWASGAPLTDGEAPGLLNRSLALVRTLRAQPLVPNAVVDKVGCVHSAPYTSSLLGFTFPAETLLLVPNPVDHTVTTLGDKGYDYTIKFLYRRFGWNKFYRPSTNSWESIYNLAGSVVKPYPPEDLSILLS